MNTFTLDFDTLEKNNIDKQKTLNFIRNDISSNFNFKELESFYKNEGFDDNQVSDMLFNDLKEANKQGLLELYVSDDILPQLSSQTKPTAQAQEAQTPQTSETSVRAHDMDLADSSPAPLEQEKKAPLPTQEKENLQKGFFESMAEGLGISTKNVQQINARRDELFLQNIQAGKSYDELSDEIKKALRDKEEENKGLFEFGRVLDDADTRGKKQYEKEQLRASILDIKNPAELSQAQREAISEDLGYIGNAFAYFFSDEKDTLKEWQENYKAKTQILPATQKAIEFLNNIHAHKSIANWITGSDEATKNDYLQNVFTIAQTAGFDEIGTDEKGHLYFFKGEEAYKINEGFIDNFTNILQANIGSISGGIAGAILGSKAGAGGTKIATTIAGGQSELLQGALLIQL